MYIKKLDRNSKIENAKQIAELEEKIEELKLNQSKLVSDLENLKSSDADLVKSQQETKECIEELEDEVNKNLQCQNNLKNEVEEKEVLQEKLKLFCQNQFEWSQWSDCSTTCRQGIKTRIDRCSSNNEQVEACNQDVSCPKSGKYYK